MKRKTLTMILCLLTCLSLVGVGFASWVISAGDKEKVTGNIVVDTVTDNRIAITVTPVIATEKDIILNGPTGATTGWLTYSGEKTENLDVEFKCVVSYKAAGKKFAATSELKNPVVKFTEPENLDYTAAKGAGCFKLGGTDEKGYEISTLNVVDGKIEFTVTVKYEWGTAFGNKNPFAYYQSLNVTDDCGNAVNGDDAATWGDHAAYYLGLLDAIDNVGNKVAYNLTIQVEPAA